MTTDIEVADTLQDEQFLERKDSRSDDMEADAEHEIDEVADSKPKKKRRIVKISDKKYECPQPDCGKAYSRAEHLYRHQLNRTYTLDIHIHHAIRSGTCA